MDKFGKSKVASQFNRTNGVGVSPEFRKTTEDVALAHAVSGNMDSYMLMFNSLAKLDTEQSLLETVANQQAQTNELQGMLAKILGKATIKGRKKK